MCGAPSVAERRDFFSQSVQSGLLLLFAGRVAGSVVAPHVGEAAADFAARERVSAALLLGRAGRRVRARAAGVLQGGRSSGAPLVLRFLFAEAGRVQLLLLNGRNTEEARQRRAVHEGQEVRRVLELPEDLARGLRGGS